MEINSHLAIKDGHSESQTRIKYVLPTTALKCFWQKDNFRVMEFWGAGPCRNRER